MTEITSALYDVAEKGAQFNRVRTWHEKTIGRLTKIESEYKAWSENDWKVFSIPEIPEKQVEQEAKQLLNRLNTGMLSKIKSHKKTDSKAEKKKDSPKSSHRSKRGSVRKDSELSSIVNSVPAEKENILSGLMSMMKAKKNEETGIQSSLHLTDHPGSRQTDEPYLRKQSEPIVPSHRSEQNKEPTHRSEALVSDKAPASMEKVSEKSRQIIVVPPTPDLPPTQEEDPIATTIESKEQESSDDEDSDDEM